MNRPSYGTPTWRSSHFFLYAPPTSESYTLSLHDALPIYAAVAGERAHTLLDAGARAVVEGDQRRAGRDGHRSEEHTSELQSHVNLVCRLLLEKKKDCHDVVAAADLPIEALRLDHRVAALV